MLVLKRGADCLSGLRSNNASLAGSVARAKAAKVSMMMFIQSS